MPATWGEVVDASWKAVRNVSGSRGTMGVCRYIQAS